MKTAVVNSNCCRQASETVPEGLPKVVLVGSPNVGKSLLFNRLTGSYVLVSNYPGTTVEVSRGKARWDGREFEVVDTPGMYSLRPLTEEERVSRSILLREKATSFCVTCTSRRGAHDRKECPWLRADGLIS